MVPLGWQELPITERTWRAHRSLSSWGRAFPGVARALYGASDYFRITAIKFLFDPSIRVSPASHTGTVLTASQTGPGFPLALKRHGAEESAFTNTTAAASPPQASNVLSAPQVTREPHLQCYPLQQSFLAPSQLGLGVSPPTLYAPFPPSYTN